MHAIEIKENETGLFDVLVNGFSYRIHRNMTKEKAAECAQEIKDKFRAMKQRARIAA